MKSTINKQPNKINKKEKTNFGRIGIIALSFLLTVGISQTAEGGFFARQKDQDKKGIERCIKKEGDKCRKGKKAHEYEEVNACVYKARKKCDKKYNY